MILCTKNFKSFSQGINQLCSISHSAEASMSFYQTEPVRDLSRMSIENGLLRNKHNSDFHLRNSGNEIGSMELDYDHLGYETSGGGGLWMVQLRRGDWFFSWISSGGKHNQRSIQIRMGIVGIRKNGKIIKAKLKLMKGKSIWVILE